MWQRFTDETKRAIMYSQQEAGGLGSDRVSTEHLLLGVIRNEDSVAAHIIRRLGLTSDQVRRAIMERSTVGDRISGQDMQLSADGKRAIDGAYDESRLLRDKYIGTEHLLLGLMHVPKGLAGRVLIELGASVDHTRGEIIAYRKEARTSRHIPADSIWPPPPSTRPFLDVEPADGGQSTASLSTARTWLKIARGVYTAFVILLIVPFFVHVRAIPIATLEWFTIAISVGVEALSIVGVGYAFRSMADASNRTAATQVIWSGIGFMLLVGLLYAFIRP